jgi:hypothetical protein
MTAIELRNELDQIGRLLQAIAGGQRMPAVDFYFDDAITSSGPRPSPWLDPARDTQEPPWLARTKTPYLSPAECTLP